MRSAKKVVGFIWEQLNFNTGGFAGEKTQKVMLAWFANIGNRIGIANISNKLPVNPNPEIIKAVPTGGVWAMNTHESLPCRLAM